MKGLLEFVVNAIVILGTLQIVQSLKVEEPVIGDPVPVTNLQPCDHIEDTIKPVACTIEQNGKITIVQR